MPGRVLLLVAVVRILVAAAAAVVASVGLPGGSRRPGEPQPVRADQRVSAEVLFEPSLSTTLQKKNSQTSTMRSILMGSPSRHTHMHYHRSSSTLDYAQSKVHSLKYECQSPLESKADMMICAWMDSAGEFHCGVTYVRGGGAPIIACNCRLAIANSTPGVRAELDRQTDHT